MKLDIVIPTLNREEKLNKCLNSIFNSAKDTKVKIAIYFSVQEEWQHFQQTFIGIDEVKIGFAPEYRVPTFWNSYLKECEADAMCYINDDVIFYPDTLNTIVKEFTHRFPDYDGVMGLNQSNIKSSSKVEAAFGIIGLILSVPLAAVLQEVLRYFIIEKRNV